ncbi:MAG: glycerate kinase [Ignavibacteriales bacterium]
MKILIAPNAFKESLPAVKIADILQNHFYRLAPQHRYLKFPISDGGDGFVDVLAYHKGLAKSGFQTKLINGSMGDIEYLYDKTEHILFVESASVIGIKHIPAPYRNVFNYDSYTLGACIMGLLNELKSASQSPEKIVIGVGGTATIDLGLGASAALSGLKFTNTVLNMDLSEAAQTIINQGVNPLQIELVLDVAVPLTGIGDMVSEFGAQKGVTPEQTLRLKSLIAELIDYLTRSGKKSHPDEALGAGGGLSIGFSLISPIKITHSSDFIWRDLNLQDSLPSADLVITSEGRLDQTSLLNKATSVLVSKCREFRKVLYVICGSAEKSVRSELERNGVRVFELRDYFSGGVEESIQKAEEGLQKCGDEIISALK